MNNIRIGVIGTGMVSQIAHLPAMARTPHAQIMALADHNIALAQQVAKRFNVPYIYNHHTELIEDKNIDAVVIVTHRHITSNIVRDALSAGKHVLSEKPMAMTQEVARELVELAQRQQRIYAVGFMKRYDPGVNKARDILAGLFASKRLGPLIFIRGKNFCAEYVGQCEDYVHKEHIFNLKREKENHGSYPEWLSPSLRQKYDWFANVGLHNLNLLRYLLNADLQVRRADLHYQNAVCIQLEATGVPVSLDLGKSATGRWEESFEFFFERGRLKLQLTSLKQRDQNAFVILDENLAEAKTTQFGTLGPWSFVKQMQTFVNAVNVVKESNCNLVTSGQDSLKDMELMDEIFSSV